MSTDLASRSAERGASVAVGADTGAGASVEGGVLAPEAGAGVQEEVRAWGTNPTGKAGRMF